MKLISFSAPGTDIARMIANARLFCADDSLSFPPCIILLKISETGVAACGCDGYAVGYDRIGDPDGGFSLQIADADAEAIERAARASRRRDVVLTVSGRKLALEGTEEPHVAMAHEPIAKWDHVLDLLNPVEDATALPAHVAFACDRLARFGRVKTMKDAPIDIRLEPAEPAPIALFRIGPTFRGMLRSISREISRENLEEKEVPDLEDCFWRA